MGRDGVPHPLEVEPRRYSTPRISPDGRSVAVTIQEGDTDDIWILDTGRGTWSRFTSGPTSEFNPNWSPDGEYIYFNRESPQFDIYRRRSDFSANAELVSTSAVDKQVTSISPDGRWLLYTESSPETASDIWILPLQGEGDPRPFLKTSVHENKAVFSRDGKWVAHVSDETGRFEVYVRPFPGPGRRWQISTDGGDEPFWSRDGRYLYYSFERVIYRVTVETEPEFAMGLPERLFTSDHNTFWGGRSYDLSPDGEQLLLVLTPSKSLPRSIRVMTNWFEELERRMP
jgi:serine/threonine-protein kinase